MPAAAIVWTTACMPDPSPRCAGAWTMAQNHQVGGPFPTPNPEESGEEGDIPP